MRRKNRKNFPYSEILACILHYFREKGTCGNGSGHIYKENRNGPRKRDFIRFLFVYSEINHIFATQIAVRYYGNEKEFTAYEKIIITYIVSNPVVKHPIACPDSSSGQQDCEI